MANNYGVDEAGIWDMSHYRGKKPFQDFFERLRRDRKDTVVESSNCILVNDCSDQICLAVTLDDFGLTVTVDDLDTEKEAEEEEEEEEVQILDVIPGDKLEHQREDVEILDDSIEEISRDSVIVLN